MAKTKTVTKQKTEVKQESRPSVVRGQILDIQQQKEKGYVNLSLLLYEAYTGKYHAEWGYQDFKSYAEAELATKYRKAMNFVEIGEKVTTLGLPKQRIEEIGWSKLRLLVSVMDQDNMGNWLDEASKKTYLELDEAVRKTRVENGELAERPKTTILKLKMSEAEAAIIESAIDEGKRLTNTDNSVLALEMICSDWLEFKGKTPQKANLTDIISYLEKVYGCKLQVQEEEDIIQDDLIDEAMIEIGLEQVVGEEAKEEVPVEEKKEEVSKPEEKYPGEDTDKRKKRGRAKKEKPVKDTVTGDKDIDDLLGL